MNLRISAGFVFFANFASHQACARADPLLGRSRMPVTGCCAPSAAPIPLPTLGSREVWGFRLEKKKKEEKKKEKEKEKEKKRVRLSLRGR